MRTLLLSTVALLILPVVLPFVLVGFLWAAIKLGLDAGGEIFDICIERMRDK